MGNNTYYTTPWPLEDGCILPCGLRHRWCGRFKGEILHVLPSFICPISFHIRRWFRWKEYLDMYKDEDITLPPAGDWVDDSFIMKEMTESGRHYSDREIKLAKKAYFAQCTLIDHQIRLVLGALRENGILDNTLIVFASDHGEMLFQHKMAGKRSFYENSSHIPLLFSGKPVASLRGKKDTRLACLEDIMPTLLEFCKIPVPDTSEGENLFGERKRQVLFGEISEGPRATRMIHDGRFKLIYYPWGNRIQLFDLEQDPMEMKDLSGRSEVRQIQEALEKELMQQLYGEDVNWISDGKLDRRRGAEIQRKRQIMVFPIRGASLAGGYACFKGFGWKPDRNDKIKMIHTSHKQEEPNMKFSEMPYERIDFDAAKEELSSIIKAFQEAGTPQEQMEVHRRYYKLMGRIKTQATLAEIRHEY